MANQVCGSARSERLLGQHKLAGFRPAEQCPELGQRLPPTIGSAYQLESGEAVQLPQPLYAQTSKHTFQADGHWQVLHPQICSSTAHLNGPLSMPPVAQENRPRRPMGLDAGANRSDNHAPERPDGPFVPTGIIFEIRQTLAVQVPQQTDAGAPQQVIKRHREMRTSYRRSLQMFGD